MIWILTFSWNLISILLFWFGIFILLFLFFLFFAFSFGVGRLVPNWWYSRQS
jgi:hypothetical protein